MLCDDFSERMLRFVEREKGIGPREVALKKQMMVQAGIVPSLEIASNFYDRMMSRYNLFGDALRHAQRFVLSPMVVEAAEEFAASQKVVQSALDYIFLPAETTWIEWRGGSAGHQRSGRHGLLLVGTGEGKAALSVGQGAYVFDSIIPGQPDDVLHEPIGFDLHDFIFRKITVPGEPTRPEDYEEVERLGRFLVCVLALINTPRVSQLIAHNIDEKLNRSRLKRGKFPLLSWHDVTIRPDVGWAPRPTHEEGTTGEKRRHHVRTFMRLKMGKVEIVKPHWRGNREKGYVIHRHVVRMEDEEAGKWKGEPLPATRILKPTDEVPED